MTDYSIDVDFLIRRYDTYGTITECDGDSQTTKSYSAADDDELFPYH